MPVHLWFDSRGAHAGNATFSQRKVQLAALQDLTWLEPEITKHTHFHWIDKKETECIANNWFTQGQVRRLNAMVTFLQLQSDQPKVTKLLSFCCMIQTKAFGKIETANAIFRIYLGGMA